MMVQGDTRRVRNYTYANEWFVANIGSYSELHQQQQQQQQVVKRGVDRKQAT